MHRDKASKLIEEIKEERRVHSNTDLTHYNFEAILGLLLEISAEVPEEIPEEEGKFYV
jgi:hypothetical protein